MNNKYLVIIGGVIIIGAVAYYLYIKMKSASPIGSGGSGKNVSNLSVCDSSIQNGDYAIVSNQADTGYSGKFVITNVTAMINDATIAGECSGTVSAFIKAHPFANGNYWTTP